MSNEHNIDSQFNACMHKEYCLSLKAGQIRPLDENALAHTINMMPWRTDELGPQLREFAAQLWLQFCSVPAAAPAPAVPQDSDPTSKEQYRRMFGAACEALGAISDALGCDPEDGGAEPILGALEELQISLGLSNGTLGCLSAAQALQEGEPVMWVMRAHETGQLNPAMPNQKAKHPKIWSDAFPLYAAPSQPLTLTDGQALKDAFEEGYCSRSTYNDVDISDVETEWAKSSAKASIAALREKEARK